MSTKSYTQELKDNIQNFWKGFMKWLDDHDSDGWPVLLVFFAVVTLGMYMSFDAFRLVVGDIPALLISVFFEASILAWKVTGSRKRNDAHQNQLANWATWLSVFLAVGMLIVNLFRVGGNKNFENIAYIIVGVAACTQVVFYLLFDQANPDKQMAREHSQANRELTRKQVKAKNVIGELESDVQIIRFIVQELQRISRESADLPMAQREYLLEAARKKLLAQYAEGKDDIDEATRGLADLNKDGRIGERPVQKLPREMPREMPFLDEDNISLVDDPIIEDQVTPPF